jgi:flagellar export protein FliJ
MKPFRFPLKSLRVLRQQKERAMQKRYVEALRACDEAAARLDAGSHELAAAWSALCEEVTEGATVGQLRQTRAWCATLEQRCEQLAAALKLAQQTTHEASRDMMLATRDREALDRLRNKQRHNFNRGVQRDEQKQLDEMGLRLSLPGLCSPRGEISPEAHETARGSSPRAVAAALLTEGS